MDLKGKVKVYDAIKILDTLIDDIHELRENGETDLRTVLRYIQGARTDLRRLPRE